MKEFQVPSVEQPIWAPSCDRTSSPPTRPQPRARGIGTWVAPGGHCKRSVNAPIGAPRRGPARGSHGAASCDRLRRPGDAASRQCIIGARCSGRDRICRPLHTQCQIVPMRLLLGSRPAWGTASREPPQSPPVAPSHRCSWGAVQLGGLRPGSLRQGPGLGRLPPKSHIAPRTTTQGA